MNDIRQVYSRYFYTLLAITKSEKYLKIKSEMLKNYSDAGFPIPDKGFNRGMGYVEWDKKVAKAVTPPINYTLKALDVFNLDKNNKTLSRGMHSLLFFNSQIKATDTIGFPHVTKNVHGTLTLTLDIYPWSTQEDFDNLGIWQLVNTVKGKVYKKTYKNKYWDNFERDLTIYKLYQQVQEDIAKGIYKYVAPNRTKPNEGVLSVKYTKPFQILHDAVLATNSTKIAKVNQNTDKIFVPLKKPVDTIQTGDLLDVQPIWLPLQVSTRTKDWITHFLFSSHLEYSF